MHQFFTYRRRKLASLLLLAPALLAGVLVFVTQKPVYAANPTTINFQGKVVNANGTNEASGTVSRSFVFRIYNNSGTNPNSTTCALEATCLWEETQGTVSVTDGVFQVELGGTCPFFSTNACNKNTIIDFNTSNALYLTLKFNGDANGYMTPLMHFQSVPYAYNTDRLGGLTSAGFIQNTTSPQSSSNFNISGTGVANLFHAPAVDSVSGVLGIGTSNATAITIGNVTNTTVLFNLKNSSTTALQVKNGSGNELFTVDTTGSEIELGKIGSGGINGSLVFNTTHASNTAITISAAATATAYSLTLPTTGPSTSQCLKSGAVTPGLLVFDTCGGGTLAAVYNSAATTGNTITLSSSGGGVVIQDAASPIGANLFTIQKNAGTTQSYFAVTTSSVVMQDTAGNSALVFDSTTSELKIYDNSTSPTNFASITADGSSATFKSNTGTTTIGNGTGAITLNSGSGAAVNITGHAASVWQTDAGSLTINSGSGSALTLTGNAASTWSTSSGALTLTSAAAATWSTAAGGLTLQGGSTLSLLSTTSSAISLDSGTVGAVNIGTGANNKAITIGSTTSGTTVSLVGGTTANTAVSISTSGAGGITIDSGTTGNINIGTGANSKAVAIGSTTSGTTVVLQGGTTANTAISLSTSGAGGITIDSGTTGNINIGNNANAKAVAIGNATVGTTITSTAGGVVHTVANSGVTIKTNTNSLTAFQVQNSSSVPIFNINTLSTGLNLVANSSLEQNINGWIAKATPTSSTPIWDNTASNANFGTATLRLSTDAAADGASFAFPFKASTQYSLSFYAKVLASTQAYVIGRQDVASDGDCAGTITATTTYQQFTCTFTTGATIGGASNFYIKQSGAGTPTIFIDGVTLVESGTAQAYVNPADNIQIDANYSNITLNADQNPELQQWRLNENPLTTARRGASTVTSNGFIYFIGGTTSNGASGAAVTTINFAKLNSDGSVGAWSTSGITALPVALYGHSSFVANGYLYVIGGCSAETSFAANCSAAVSTVYYSKLNGDGTNGTWQTNAYALGAAPGVAAAARGYGAAVSSGGFVYFMGGTSGSAVQTTSYSAKINADGSLSPWVTSGVTVLTAARYGHTALAANGSIYVIGGCNDTTDTAADCDSAEGLTTVQQAVPTLTGGLGSWTTATSLPTATGLHTSAVLNGYIYNVGGRQAGAPVTSVTYSKITSTSALGIWSTATNALPTGEPRQGAAGIWANNYVYVLGGFDGTSTLPTSTLYSSGARVQVFGGLDLVGLTGQGLGDYGGGGTLTAGNTRVVGDLRVEGFADFNNGLSVDSALNINAVSATNGQTIFNINNSSSNSIFNIRHMAANFGSLVSAGAFMQKNSYFGEEFNISPVNASQTCLANATETNAGWSRGDIGSHNNAAITCGTSLDQFSGEFNWSTKNGAATASQGCTVAYQNTLNGVERITATSTATGSNSASCTEALAATRTTSNKIYLAANLPVATYKVKAQTLTASQNTDRIRIGLSNVNTATATGSPTDGIYFSNCSTESTTSGSVSGCSNTTWYGHSFNGSAEATAGPVTCSVGAGSLTAQFSYLRIEVRSATDVHFYADYSTADGINEVECGTGITGTATSAAMTTWTHVTVATNAARSVVADLDYIRTWQDDNDSLPQEAVTTTPTGEDIITEAPLAAETVGPEDPNALFSFNAATSEDLVVEKDLYVKGTLFANKIKANQIEGLEVFTDKIGSLQERLAKALNPTVSAQTANSSEIEPNITPLNLSVDGGLTIGGTSEFHGNVFFYKLVTFAEKTIFNNDVSFAAHITTAGNTPTIKLEDNAGITKAPENNPDAKLAKAEITGNDISGQLNTKIGDDAKEGEIVNIRFKKSYDKAPQIFLSAANGAAVHFKYYTPSTSDGFKIVATDPPEPGTNLQFYYWIVQ